MIHNCKFIFLHKVKDGLEIRLGSGIAPDRSIEVKVLPRQKCETLANYYLGFNGWSGKVQYHKQEETEEGKVDQIIDGLDCLFLKVKVVSIARLDFPQSGLYCEGAGMAEAELTSVEQKGKVRGFDPLVNIFPLNPLQSHR